jgi:hypothetical protein
LHKKVHRVQAASGMVLFAINTNRRARPDAIRYYHRAP